ncbi:MAG: hypothetical protein ACTSR8_07690 [Promethearchaeota archaeon]
MLSSKYSLCFGEDDFVYDDLATNIASKSQLLNSNSNYSFKGERSGDLPWFPENLEDVTKVFKRTLLQCGIFFLNSRDCCYI